MTSTSFNVGIAGESKLSSRVIKPPGGGHTDIFGVHDQEPVRTGRRQCPQQAGQIKLAESPQKQAPQCETEDTNGSSAEVTEAEHTNGSYHHTENGNEHKEEAPKEESPKEEAPKMEAPKRVRVPPGGFSSGLW